MKELELKYGCNPNQKPSRIYMQDGSDLPDRGTVRTPGIYQFPGCVQRLAACIGVKESDRASGGDFF